MTNEVNIVIYLSFIQQILTTNLLIGIVLGIGDTLANKTDKNSCTHGVSILLEEIINNINK